MAGAVSSYGRDAACSRGKKGGSTPRFTAVLYVAMTTEMAVTAKTGGISDRMTLEDPLESMCRMCRNELR